MPTAPISTQSDIASPLMAILGLAASSPANPAEVSSFADSLWSALGDTSQSPASLAGGPSTAVNPIPSGVKKEKQKDAKDFLEMSVPAAFPVLAPPLIGAAQPPTVQAGASAADASTTTAAIPGAADPATQSTLPSLAKSAVSAVPGASPPVPRLVDPHPAFVPTSLPASPAINEAQVAAFDTTHTENAAGADIPLPGKIPVPAAELDSTAPQFLVPGSSGLERPMGLAEPDAGGLTTSPPITTSPASPQVQPVAEAPALTLAQIAASSLDPARTRNPISQPPQTGIAPHTSATPAAAAPQSIPPGPRAVDLQAAQRLLEQAQFTEIPLNHSSVASSRGEIAANNFAAGFRNHTPASSSLSSSSLSAGGELPTAAHSVKDAHESHTVSAPTSTGSKPDSDANSSGGASPQESVPLAPAPSSHSQISNDVANGAAAINSAVNSPAETPGATPAAKAPLPAPDPPAPTMPAANPVQVAHLMDRAGQTEMHIDLRTSAFGSVEVHTVVRDSQVGVTMGSERGDLKTSLASEVPGLQAAFRQQDLRFDAIHFLRQGAELNTGLSGGTDSHSQSPRQGHTPARFSTLEERPGASIEAETSRTASGLNVHA